MRIVIVSMKMLIASPRCPYFIDPANNDLTGRVIEDTQVKELIVQLHNEVRFPIQKVKTILDINCRFEARLLEARATNQKPDVWDLW